MSLIGSAKAKVLNFYAREVKNERTRAANMVRRVPCSGGQSLLHLLRLFITTSAPTLRRRLAPAFQGLVKALAFFAGAVFISRNFGEAFAI
jgi:hypothetical protein